MLLFRRCFSFIRSAYAMYVANAPNCAFFSITNQFGSDVRGIVCIFFLLLRYSCVILRYSCVVQDHEFKLRGLDERQALLVANEAELREREQVNHDRVHGTIG